MTHHSILDICICHAFYAVQITIVIVTWLLLIVAGVAAVLSRELVLLRRLKLLTYLIGHYLNGH